MCSYQYLRLCLGVQKGCPPLSSKEWIEIYNFCLQQSLLGIGYQGLERLSSDATIPMYKKYQWIGNANQISNQNKLLDKRCLELQRMFAEAGFATYILKGQGNALMYPNPLSRTPGDIDIWVTQKAQKTQKHNTKSIIKFLGTKCDIKKQVIGYHHVEFPIFKDVEVEVHWRPSWRSSPLYNKRLQKWFKCNVNSTEIAELPNGAGKITVPTWEFNVVYLLQHMFLHIFQEGLGLRQVVDYYYLLKSEGRGKKADVSDTLRYLGLYDFAGAVMYVLREVFLLDAKYMIAPVDKRRGKHLLGEILQSGNFGRYDERNKSLLRKKGIARSIARLKRQYRFLRDYPHETLCAPFQIYHVIWRRLQLWRWK